MGHNFIVVPTHHMSVEITGNHELLIRLAREGQADIGVPLTAAEARHFATLLIQEATEAEARMAAMRG